MNARILAVDDDPAMIDTLRRSLTRRGFTVDATTSAKDALERLGQDDPDVLLTDLRMREMDGIALCVRALDVRPDLPVVVITGFGSLETATQAIRAGAYDFVTKPFDVDAVEMVLQRAVEHRRLREEVRRLRARTGDGVGFGELIGESEAMRRVYDLVDRVGGSDTTVLLHGETGTGKELVARALHRRSRRSAGPFVAINCAAMPETLLESELFGHARGAFTDARAARRGLFLQADQGTLFLDEIGEMPMAMQVKLLRVLQERRVRPVGADAEVPFDARIVAATHRDLQSMVDEGRFREDLYFRLGVVPISLPPLRARGQDVLLLAQVLLAEAASGGAKEIRGFAPDAARLLLAYSWPGNVRELRNCVEHAVALARFDVVTVDDLPERVRSHRPEHLLVVPSADPEELVPLEEIERRYVLKVLEAVDGHRGRAAKVLGLDRKTLYRKLERWGEKGPFGG